jgi:hypothetical protein
MKVKPCFETRQRSRTWRGKLRRDDDEIMKNNLTA